MSEIGPVAIWLKQCPCCGGKAVCENFVVEAAVRCTDCGLKVVRKHRAKDERGIKDAAFAWNRRTV